MAQQGPNPIEVYESVVKALMPIMAGVTASQLSSTTPCTEWTVQSLINHALAVQVFGGSVLSKASPDMASMGNVDHALPSEGAEAAFKSITDTTLAALKRANLEDTVETPFGAMPAGNFIMIPITDMIIHKWDLAKATGQGTSLDSGLAEVGLQVLQGALAKGRDPNFFAAEISLPATASVQDKLLAFSGRQP